MTTQLKDLMSLADNYAQACVDLECENQERRGIVDGSSVAAVDESRQQLENELRRIEKDEALLRQALEALESSMYPQKKQNVAITALQQRLGEKA